jgi:hypothetical protein
MKQIENNIEIIKFITNFYHVYLNNMINKINILFLIILSLSLLSCKDNPQIPPQKYSFDTARYNWKIDTLPIFMKDVYAVDSNNVFFLSDFEMYHYHNNIYNNVIFTGTNMQGFVIDGTDENNIWIAGNDITNLNFERPKLIKWNGAAIENIIIPDTTNEQYHITSMRVKSLNEIWLGSDSGKIIRYDGFNNFKIFSIDSNYYVYRILKNEMNEIYCATIRDSFDIGYTWGMHYEKIYKSESDSLILVWSKTYSNVLGITVDRLGEKIIGSDGNYIYSFINNDFIPSIKINNFDIIYIIDGNSFENLLVAANNFNSYGCYSCLYHWDGKNWSFEIKSIFDGNQNMISKVSFKNGKYICVSQSAFFNLSFIYYSQIK